MTTAVTIHIEHYSIKVKIAAHTISLDCDQALQRLVKEQGSKGLESLCRQIQEAFHSCNGRPFQVSMKSLWIEIVGHLHAYKWLKILRRWRLLKPLHHSFSKLSDNAYQIDCGEKAHDSNRWFWDLMTPSKHLLVLFFK